MIDDFSPQRFWDNLDMKKPLFARWLYMSTNFASVLRAIMGNIEGNHKKLLNIFIRNKNIAVDQKTQFNNLRRKLDMFYYDIAKPNKEEGRLVTDSEMVNSNLSNNEFKMQLGVFSQLLVCAYPDYKIPDWINELVKSAPKPKGSEQMLLDMDMLSKLDLAENLGNRALVLFIIDNSIYMEGPAFEELQVAFEGLFEELKKDQKLLYSVELYISTCGCAKEEQPTEIVRFATVERQLELLDNMILDIHGRCKMGKTINLALDRLENHIRDMKEGDNDVAYYRPWLIILSDGKFKDDMAEAYERVAKLKEMNEIRVYPKALTKKADLAALRQLDEKEASLLKSVNAFFKDIFQSLKITENQTPGSDRFNIVHSEGFQS